jgi:hypothetical protein
VSRQVLDELKQQIPLLDYLQAQDWQPARQLSRGRWMGVCPLHSDHKPSFLVDSTKSLFYCYGCGRGGDVIRFAELYHQVMFPKRWGYYINGVAWRRYYAKPQVSTACSYTATVRRLNICTNAESARRN